MLDVPKATGLDVGANVGLWTIPMAQQCRAVGGRVIAFEPLPANAERLKTNIRLNDLVGQVTLIEAGLSDVDGSAELTMQDGVETGNAVITFEGLNLESRGIVRIRVATLDGLQEALALERLDVIKVDIEGHEDRFFNGARDTIARWRPVIVAEWCSWLYEDRGVNAESVLTDSLKGLNYKVVRKSAREWIVSDRVFSPLVLDNLFLIPGERLDSTMMVIQTPRSRRRFGHLS
jgi:FkbM family methyltransferase